MRHLSNIPDPTSKGAKERFVYTKSSTYDGDIALDYAWKGHLDWVNSNIIGDPIPTSQYTVKELKERNWVGLYSKED